MNENKLYREEAFVSLLHGVIIQRKELLHFNLEKTEQSYYFWSRSSCITFFRLLLSIITEIILLGLVLGRISFKFHLRLFATLLIIFWKTELSKTLEIIYWIKKSVGKSRRLSRNLYDKVAV